MTADCERVDMAVACAAAAKKIVSRTNDPEAAKYLEYLLSSGVVGCFKPDGNRIRTVELGPVDAALFNRPQPSLTIFPVFEVDRGHGEGWRIFYQAFLNNSCLGQYLTATKGDEIYLRVNMGSAFLMGCTLLHEVGHHFYAESCGGLGRKSTPVENDLSESRLHTMEARLWRLWGGNRYHVIMEEAFSRLEKDAQQWQASNGLKGPTLSVEGKGSWSAEFDEIFGVAPNQAARNCRLNKFHLYALLEWIERKGHQPLDQLRARAIRVTFQQWHSSTKK